MKISKEALEKLIRKELQFQKVFEIEEIIKKTPPHSKTTTNTEVKGLHLKTNNQESMGNSDGSSLRRHNGCNKTEKHMNHPHPQHPVSENWKHFTGT